jgi:hypothetical protein
VKFFKWRIDLKIKRLDADQRILFLAGALIKEIKNSGRDMSFKQGGKVVMPVTLDIYVHNSCTPTRLSVQNSHNDWEVHGDYNG